MNTFWKTSTRTHVLLALLCLCVLPNLFAQDIISTSGVLMEGLEPWDTVSVVKTSPDEGILDRILKMLQPHVLRLNQANSAVKETLESSGRQASANTALERQRVVCEDILAVIGIINRHNSEVASWKIEASRDQYLLTPEFFASDIFRRIMKTASASSDADPNSAVPGPTRPDSEATNDTDAIQWPYLAAIWAPFMVGVEFGVEQLELLTNLGLSASAWQDAPDLALCALLVLLRQATVTTEKRVVLTKGTNALLEEMNTNYIEKYELGSRHLDLTQGMVQLESLLGFSAIQPFLNNDNVKMITLELGSYHYPTIPYGEAAVDRVSSEGPIPKAFLDKTIWTDQVGEAFSFYLEKARLYVDLASDLAERVTSLEDPKAAEQVAHIYAPFLSALARCTPCLSAFRPKKQGKQGIRITESWISAQNDPVPDLWRVDGTLHDAFIVRGVEPFDYLFLLQSDFSPDAQGAWHWTPRVAGYRGYLNVRNTSTKLNVEGN